MIKKWTMVVLLLVFLSGCDSITSESKEDRTLTDILYETKMALRQELPVSIYDSITLTSYHDMESFEVKLGVFDITKTQALEMGTVSMRTSESSGTEQFSNEGRMLTVKRSMQYQDTRRYVMHYATLDFSAYLTSSFLNDMSKLENNEMTADELFSKYGTHVIMSVREGYKIRIDLSIESNDLSKEEMIYLKEQLLDTNPVTFPIMDENFMLYQEKSRIILNVRTTWTEENLSSILSNPNSSIMIHQPMFLKEDIIPLHELFRSETPLYPNAINKMMQRYTQLFSVQ